MSTNHGQVPPSKKVWVGGLGPGTTEHDVQTFFTQYGPVESVQMLPEQGGAHVMFFDKGTSSLAAWQSRGKAINGKEIRTTFVHDTAKDINLTMDVSKQALPTRVLFLRNLPPHFTDQNLATPFAQFGELEGIKIVTSKSCAFVTFKLLPAAIAARNRMTGTVLGDPKIAIEFGKETQAAASTQTSFEAAMLAARSAAAQHGAAQPQQPVSAPPMAQPGVPGAAVAGMAGAVPQPPSDAEIKNIIDKMAEYVARNGPEFEATLRQKKGGDPRFSFLFGGQNTHYYHHRVMQITQQQQQQQHGAAAPQQQQPPPPPSGGPPGAVPHPPPGPPGGTVPSSNGSAGPPPGGALAPPASTMVAQAPGAPVAAAPPTNPANASANGAPQAPRMDPQATEALRQLLAGHQTLKQLRVQISPTADADLKNRVGTLDGSRDSIKDAKDWIIGHPEAAAVCQRAAQMMIELPSHDTHLQVVYLFNDVLHSMITQRPAEGGLDNISTAILSVLPTALSISIRERDLDPPYVDKVLKVVQLWGQRNIFDAGQMNQLAACLTATEIPPPAAPAAPLPHPPAYVPHHPPPAAYHQQPPPYPAHYAPPAYHAPMGFPQASPVGMEVCKAPPLAGTPVSSEDVPVGMMVEFKHRSTPPYTAVRRNQVPSVLPPVVDPIPRRLKEALDDFYHGMYERDREDQERNERRSRRDRDRDKDDDRRDRNHGKGDERDDGRRRDDERASGDMSRDGSRWR